MSVVLIVTLFKRPSSTVLYKVEVVLKLMRYRLNDLIYSNFVITLQVNVMTLTFFCLILSEKMFPTELFLCKYGETLSSYYI